MNPLLLPVFLITLLALAGARASAATLPPRPDGVVRATLANGMRVVVVRDAIAPVVSTTMNYLVGSNDDPPAIPGLAHAQEHMMYRGTAAVSTDQLSTIATALGGSFNAQTRPTVTQFQFTVPRADLGLILHIEADRMRDVLDSQSEWNDERGAIEQEVAMDETTPGASVFREIEGLAYAGTPYAHDGVGTKAVFDALTGEQIHGFHRRWYAPNNAVLVIAGDVDQNAAISLVRSEFGAIGARRLPAHTPIRFAPLARTTLERRTTLPSPLSVVAYRIPGLASPDFLPCFMLTAVLDSDRSELHALENSGTALSASFEMSGPYRDGELVYATGALPPGGDARGLTARLEAVLAHYARGGIPDELFEAAKRRTIADQELSRNSVSALASDWSDVVVIDHEPSVAHEVELLRAVTRADVERVARKYLVPGHAVIATLLTGGAGAPAEPRTSIGQPTKEAPIPERARARTLPDWARGAIDGVRVPELRVRPTDVRLANGIRLIVQPETISRSVIVAGAVDQNTALDSPPGKDGVADVLDRMFDLGTGHRNREEFHRELDRIAANESAGSRFAMSLTSESFERGVNLLAENEVQPRLQPAEFAQARESVAGSVATILNGSRFAVRRLRDERLYPAGDPALRFATPQSVGNLTLDDIRTYYSRVYRPERTTIIVVGAITPKRARAAIERAFAGWKADGAPPSGELPPVPLNSRGSAAIRPPGERQDYVTLSQLLPVTRNDFGVYALEVADTIFGGGMGGPSTSRLFRDLRQNTGLAYAVNATLAIGATRSSYDVNYACDPDNAQRARELVARDAHALGTELVPADELALAKAAMVRRIVIAEADETAIARDLLDLALERLPLDEGTIRAKAYLATNAAAVRDAFAKFVRPDGFVQITEGP